MAVSCCGSTLYNAKSQFIKFAGGDAIAVSGADTVAKLMLSDLRFKYYRLSNTSTVVKKGSDTEIDITDATFVLIKATYNTKQLEKDDYLYYSVNDCSCKLTMGELLCLTGNSTNRIDYVHFYNPSENYDVDLSMLIGYGKSTDDDSSSVTSSTITISQLKNLSISNVKINGDIINVTDADGNKISYIRSDITSIEYLVGSKYIILTDSMNGDTLLHFTDADDAEEVYHMFKYDDIVNVYDKISNIIETK